MPFTRSGNADADVEAATRTNWKPAALLSVAACVTGANAFILPALDPSVTPHIVLQTSMATGMLATAAGVWRGWRPARTIARIVGFGSALALWSVLGRAVNPSSLADWWVTGAFTVQLTALGLMLNAIGWFTDEPDSRRDAS